MAAIRSTEMIARPNSPRSYKPLIVHEGHKGAITSLAFSPNGKLLVSGSYDKTIRTWNAYNPSPVGNPLIGHTDIVQSVSYSVGNIIASGSEDYTVRLWDINTSQQLGEPLEGDGRRVTAVAFSPDATLIASGTTFGAVQLWDVRRRARAADPFNGHTGGIGSIEFSSDGTSIISGSSDNTIRIWDVERGLTIVGPLMGHTAQVRKATVSPDRSQIVSCSHDCTIRFWDTRSGKPIGKPYEGHTDMVFSVAFSPDGTYIVSGARDATVRLWDIRTGQQVAQPFQEHSHDVNAVLFSPCGQYIASGSRDCNIVIRGIIGENLELSNDLESDARLGNEGDSPHIETAYAITSQMSAQQMFDCLISSGCIDLSSEMDSRQNTAMIVSGGGFGDIWMGKLYNGAKVAIKAWRTNSFEQCTYKTLKRAARELFYWSRMEHQNIHQLMGVIMFKNEYLGMVSEWMENGNLHEYLRKHSTVDRYQLCIQVASGLRYMHSCKTVHGDLKAANVLVSQDGVARLSDFDFAIMSEAGSLWFSESSNTRMGSIRWAAPEMLAEELPKRTTQSDVYALGMTILEIFTGNVPYPNCRMDFNVMLTVAQGTLPTRPMDSLGDNHQGNLIWHLLLRCWSRSINDRPSAKQVVETLLSLIGEV
ncbi:putative WD repeat-containing protein alr2800 [Nostoc sp, PCC 7120] [Rhizoctonia solani]|uniref:Putative WD repeat-containing protein alr2800 [Nostoc sp, PCC 7120] n=1 Tax=Rhizoctonia solani TaxID=456999 RepID=A0A0K6GE30_9AGAM|nr:putative WD repeat-containing protein alr2800 [Nostoc sp, PCC 7120] [Rhizoctonia solani]